MGGEGGGVWRRHVPRERRRPSIHVVWVCRHSRRAARRRLDDASGLARVRRGPRRGGQRQAWLGTIHRPCEPGGRMPSGHREIPASGWAAVASAPPPPPRAPPRPSAAPASLRCRSGRGAALGTRQSCAGSACGTSSRASSLHSPPPQPYGSASCGTCPPDHTNPPGRLKAKHSAQSSRLWGTHHVHRGSHRQQLCYPAGRHSTCSGWGEARARRVRTHMCTRDCSSGMLIA